MSPVTILPTPSEEKPGEVLRSLKFRDADATIIGGDAVGKTHRPAGFTAIDGEANLARRWQVIDGIVEQDELGAELADRKNVSVHMQLHLNIGGMARLHRS